MSGQRYSESEDVCGKSLQLLRFDIEQGQLSRYIDSLRVGRSGVLIPVRARFSGSRFYPASYTVHTGYVQGVKRPGRDVDHPHHLEPMLKKE